MIARLPATATLVAIAAIVVVACSSDPAPAASTYCDVAKSSLDKCKDATDCDHALAEASCTSLAKVVSDTTMSAAKDCLESGVCGPASCLSRAQKSATPTAAQKTLAKNFCTFCAPNVQDCESQFYSRTSRLPGKLVLPYSDDVVKAVDDACTGTDGCQAKFATCAKDVLTRELGDKVDESLATCILSGFTQDEGEGQGPGGGAQVATCTPDNCKGCCRDDKCEDGTALDACGSGAAACQICAGGQKCSGGKCKEPCNADTCNGCCNGDDCVPGTTKDSCGQKGAACTACTGQDVCSNHTCIDGSCQATCAGCCTSAGCQDGTTGGACGFGGEACVDCGFGRACTSGACTLDRASLWDVYISFAVVPDKDKSGAAWDTLNGAPDPYLVTFSSEGSSVHSGQTSVQNDTTVPFWAETPMKGIKASELLSSFSIQIWDSDVEFDDYMGGCDVPLDPANFDGSLQSFDCPATATELSVTFYYRINPHQ